jgi:hypothetical protein
MARSRLRYSKFLELINGQLFECKLSKSKYQRSGDNCNFIIKTLLNHLCQFNLIKVCLNLMKHIYFDHWKKVAKVNFDTISDAFDMQTQAAVNNANLSGLMKLSYESRY